MIEPNLDGYKPEDVKRIASERLQAPYRQAPPQSPQLEELSKKVRLYTHGGSIHYGVPPEDR